VSQNVDQLLQEIEQEEGDVDAAVDAVAAAAETEAAVQRLSQRLVDHKAKASVRRQAAYALGLLGSPAAVNCLGKALLQDPDENVRRVALGVLEQNDPAGNLLFFQGALQDQAADIRNSAAVSLGLAVRQLALEAQNDQLSDSRKQAAAERLQQVKLSNLKRMLYQDVGVEADQPLSVPQAAAVALGAVGPAAIPTLCEFLQSVQEAQNQAERQLELRETEWLERELEHDKRKALVVQTAINALRDIGAEAVLPCLIKTLRQNRNFRVRREAVSALQRLGYKQAIPHLIYAFLEDPAPEVQQVAAKALAESFLDWREKATQVVHVLREGQQQRGQVDTLAIVNVLVPPEAELKANPHLLTDYFIGQAIDNSQNERLLALLAALIITCANSSMSLAGERLDAYSQTMEVNEVSLQPLRLEIGGAKALTPILSRLEKNLEKYFQEPIQELNTETGLMWRRLIYIAYVGFGLRSLMSVVLFGIGAYLTVSSFERMAAGTLDLDRFAGAGVSFIAGLATMAVTVFSGPLKEIRRAVDDVGAANATFIAYIHRVLQVSHTFSYYYLQGKISFQELERAGKLIEETLTQTVSKLREKGK
jgi:HEAT repeat protein